MLNEEGLTSEEAKWIEEEEGLDEREDLLTQVEMFELTILHEKAMSPTQEEEDWMLLINIKKQRKDLANLYWPDPAKYKIEDICDICN